MNGSVLPNVTGVAIGGRALLIEGPPGSGKTSLALALIDRGAVLVGDDGVHLRRNDGVLIAAPPPSIAGLVEVRNLGPVEMPVTEAPVALVLALDRTADRYPLEARHRVIEGVSLPLLAFAPGDAIQALRAELALERHGLPFPRPDERAMIDRDG